MRPISVVALLFLLSAVMPIAAGAQAGALPAVDIPAADIQALTGPSRKANTLPNIRVVDAGGHHVAVGALYRTDSQPQPAAVHYKVSEVYYVLNGEATLVTGGTVVNPKTRPAESPQVRQQDGPGTTGTAIDGGTSRQIKQGDVVIIPAGTPHWFSKINGSLAYVVIRVDPNQILDLK
jgi:mannose-6-phosphate isomerase-like protein (cupin superfamily)